MSNQANARRNVRCAVYTRKSTEEGLEQAFNSLDAQREAAEAYIASQQQEGWTCLPQRYDDGGFTGANIDRPALQRLLADMAAGHIDCVLVNKVDRLSRSLLDFAKMMEAFDKHRIAFVSITQQFNSATSMGRLILNVLLSFAQFERELISERTRDKIGAARRKGKWSGGTPVLGYDVDVPTTKLVVNEAEAVQVRAIFELYLRRQTLRAVLDDLEQRGWVNKRWRTRKGCERGGRPFTLTSLQQLLTNVLYAGHIKHKGALFPGEHDRIVDATIWRQVQEMLGARSRTKEALVRTRCAALLKGLLHCRPCGCPMTPTYAAGKGGKRYRYYVCTGALKFGRSSCPAPSLAAIPVEQVVFEQLKELSQDGAPAQALFDQNWLTLAAGEQVRLLRLLVERVDYDGHDGKLVLALHARGRQRLAEEWPGETS
jgi:site-specific DNA recombinase